MIVYLIRHTTPNIEKGICYGQADIDVADNFEDESNFILNKLKYVDTETVISSPLLRCVTLAKKINSTFHTNTNIKELDFGDWELMPWNDIPTTEIDPWMIDFVNTPVTNGESYMDLYQRSIDFYKTISNNNSIIVTHAGVIRSILAHITNTALKDSFDFKIPYSTIVKIDTETNEYNLL
ncbi:alpha-ribazole phosphatase family protein [Wenyingzhuangia sp. IMCC45533]